mgnify:CR=1 FL=1
MARNEGILVNDFRKMMLDGHTDKIIKMFTFDDKTLVDIIANTMVNKNRKRTIGRESRFTNTYTSNVLACPIDFIQVDVTTRTYPANTVIYTFDIMYYNDVIEHMGINMEDYCHHKITVSDSGLYTKRFAKWVKDTATDIYKSLVSAWKFADKHVPEFVAMFDAVLDERKSQGIDIGELYGAYVPAKDMDDNTTTVSAKDDDGVKIITVKNPKNVDKIIKLVTDHVKNFRKDATSTVNDLMEKINASLDAEGVEHTYKDYTPDDVDADTTPDDIQDEQSDPDREPEPEDDIHEPVEDESTDDECDIPYSEYCDACMQAYIGNPANIAERYTDIINRTISSQLLNNMQNYMVRNKLTKYEVELIPNSVNISATAKVVLQMERFHINYKELDSKLDGTVSVGVYNREKNTCYYKVMFDFREITLQDVETCFVDKLTDLSIPQREEQIFDAISDYIDMEIDYAPIFFAVAYAEGWNINDPEFKFDPEVVIGINRHAGDSAYGTELCDIAYDSIDDTDNEYMDSGFAEFYNNLDEETLHRYDADDQLWDGDEDWDECDEEDDDSVSLEDIVDEKNGYFMTDVDTKEE